jgi:ATP synthase protein I
VSDPDEAKHSAQYRAAQMAKLDAKIENAVRQNTQSKGKRHQDEHYSQAQQGWRMVIELVAGILIGFAVGYGLDSLFGTLPIFLVVFILLGFAAGVRTMMRTAKELQEERLADEADTKDLAPDATKGTKRGNRSTWRRSSRRHWSVFSPDGPVHR